MANKIAYAKNYTAILDEVYQRETCSTVLNSPKRLARAGRNAKEIMVPKVSVSGLGNYTLACVSSPRSIAAHGYHSAGPD